jgi:hypothetical protein
MNGEKKDGSVSRLEAGLMALSKLIWLSATAPFRKTVPWDRFPRSDVLYLLGLAGIAVFSWVGGLVSGNQPPSMVNRFVWVVMLVLMSFAAAKAAELDARWRVGLACSTAFIVLMSVFGGLVDRGLMVWFDILAAINILRFIVAHPVKVCPKP